MKMSDHEVSVVNMNVNGESGFWLMSSNAEVGVAHAFTKSGHYILRARAYGEQAGKDPFELAILDMQMPEMDGLMLAQCIKSDPAIASTHLVMLPSLGNQLDTADMKQAGIEACVLKPVKQSKLFNRLADVMAGHVTLAKSATKSGMLPPNRATEPPPKPAPKAPRILLAEDNVINQKVAVGLLNNIGYSAHVVSNGLEVLAALERTPYDLILMDCQMPELDGYETTQRIRARQSTHVPRIVAMTANAMRGESEKCLAAGMDDYLSKPVRLEALRDMVTRWMPELSAQ